MKDDVVKTPLRNHLFPLRPFVPSSPFPPCLRDVFFDPVIVPVHTVPPDVGLFGDKHTGLVVRRGEIEVRSGNEEGARAARA